MARGGGGDVPGCGYHPISGEFYVQRDILYTTTKHMFTQKLNVFTVTRHRK